MRCIATCILSWNHSGKVLQIPPTLSLLWDQEVREFVRHVHWMKHDGNNLPAATHMAPSKSKLKRKETMDPHREMCGKVLQIPPTLSLLLDQELREFVRHVPWMKHDRNNLVTATQMVPRKSKLKRAQQNSFSSWIKK